MNDNQDKHLLECVKKDPWHRQFLEECRALEPEYLRVMESLPENDREIIEQYITLCQAVDYRETVTAYFLHPIN